MVEKIRELCKKNGTSISKLEKQLGYGNGVIGRWDKSVPNFERLSAVASALNVTIDDLTGIKKEPAPEGELNGFTARYSKLSADNQAVIDAMLDALLKSQSDA